MKSFKKVLAVTLAVATLAPSLVFAEKKDYGSAKNVIMMIPDGMSVEALTTARWMTKDKKFVMDDLATGLVRTNNSNTPIADSAPAGTAMAAGIKTESPFVGCYPTKAGMPGSLEIEKDIVSAMGRIISARSHITWTTGGHVGGDIGLYSYSTAEKAERLIGTVHNYEIGRYMEDILDIDLDKLTEELYQPIRKGFEDKGAKVEFKKKGENDYEVIVTKGDDKIIFPVSKNYAIKNGEKVELDGLTIYSTRAVYVPQSAFDLVK